MRRIGSEVMRAQAHDQNGNRRMHAAAVNNAPGRSRLASRAEHN
jgi:hypothetical protein